MYVVHSRFACKFHIHFSCGLSLLETSFFFLRANEITRKFLLMISQWPRLAIKKIFSQHRKMQSYCPICNFMFFLPLSLSWIINFLLLLPPNVAASSTEIKICKRERAFTYLKFHRKKIVVNHGSIRLNYMHSNYALSTQKKITAKCSSDRATIR